MPGYYRSFFICIHLIKYDSAGNVGHVCFLSSERKFDICTFPCATQTWVITVFIWATQWVFCRAALELYNWNWSIAAFFVCPALLKKAIWLRPLGSCWVAPMYSHGYLKEPASLTIWGQMHQIDEQVSWISGRDEKQLSGHMRSHNIIKVSLQETLVLLDTVECLQRSSAWERRLTASF